MERFFNGECDPKLLSPLTLAFIGDTVYDLFVREELVCRANRPVGKLHNAAVRLVNAQSQARAAEIIAPLLSEEELSVFKRGRNAKPHHLPKNASESDYHHATGLEALFGYLYLQGNIERLRELFDYIGSTCVNRLNVEK